MEAAGTTLLLPHNPRQHLFQQPLKRSGTREILAVQDEAVYPQVDKAAHLFDDLLRRAHKAKVFRIGICV
jgi:hypothetical protein